MHAPPRLPVLLVTLAALILPGSAALAVPDRATGAVGQAGRPQAPVGDGTAGRLEPGAGSIAWEPCPTDATADCGTLRVPVDWDNPGAGSFELAIARRRATDPAARIGSLVVNPGGPGSPGTGFAMRARGYFSAELNRRFDIVGFDPRGVGRSHPVICSSAALAATPVATPTNQAEFEQLREANGKLAQDCRAHTGPLYDHVDTLSVVRDIDALRAALGDEALSFYGLSYGTLMGQQYAEQFPDRVRAIVVDSNMDHSVDTEGFLDSQALAAQDSFNEFVAGCRPDPGCALYGQDIQRIWSDLLARARRGELYDPPEQTYRITEHTLINMAFGSFYRPRWSELATNIKSLHNGRPSGPGAARAAASAALRAAGSTSWRPQAAAAGPGPSVAPYPFRAIFCQDWSLPVRDYPDLARHLSRMAALAPDMPYSPLALGALLGCVGGPEQVNNPQHRLRVAPTSRPLLVVNALHDPATGYPWAVSAAEQLGDRAVLVAYEGWGHGVYGRGPCATGVIDRYLVAGAVPAAGTSCPADGATTPAPSTAPAVPTGPRPNIAGWS
ncbi:MAG TPA: alpha/beta fold hydrolase [Catenuloplanes sp.]